MRCASCGTENEAGRKFCEECGARLAAGCPVCGGPNAATAKFCGECGTKLSGAWAPDGGPVVASPSSPVPVAERRVVSVLFADLVGFTTLSEGRDAEDTRALLSRYFDLAREVIERYGGTVEKFIGDAVMAVWGAPTAHEDDAERAVRAGLELVDAVRSLGPGLQARAGVLTGEAAVTLGATNQGMVAGDLVNTASRLQSVAPPGAVLVGEATQRATARAIAFEEAGEQLLKGRTSPVPAWRAVRVVARVGGRNRSDSLEAPFVGRDDELRQLKDLYHATSRDRRARLVSVVGPAGIGKSRLAWELHKYLDGLIETIWAHDGRSPAYGEGISFWALGEMVRARCGLFESDDEATTRAKVAEALATHVPDETERRWIEPAILTLLGVETSGAGPQQLFAAWRTFFERLAASAPVVMIFEDLHFADAGLLDFVDHLLEWSRTSPIYVVTLARPELLERRPTWGAGKRNFTSLYLEPLSETAMRELLAGLVPGLPEPTVRAIVARADGVPLYAVETVRMLLANGRLAPQGDVYRPVGDLTSLAVPETLTALISSRLDGLAPDERALISDAAVLGQSFSLAGLAAVSGVAEAELEPRLRILVRRELLTLEADPRSPEVGQYAFVQALIREVAYNTLARADRKGRHLAAARFFESVGSDELAGALAGHYLAAHQNAEDGPEADALAVQARIALKAAAERAAALGSPEQAVGFLRQALTIAADPREEAELLERAGEAASSAAHHDEAEALLRQAIERHRERGDRGATMRAAAALGRAYLQGSRTEQALAILERAAEEFADLDADAGFVELLGQLARGYMFHEEHGRAVAVADRALPMAERADLVALVADTLVTKGASLAGLGRAYEGLAEIEGGLRLADRHALPVVALRARLNLGAFQSQGDLRASLESSRAGISDARRLGRRSDALLFVANGAECSTWTGEWDWAPPELEELLSADLEREDRIQVLGSLFRIRCWRGEESRELLDEIGQLAGPAPEPSVAASVAGAQAERDLALGAFTDGRAASRRMAGLSALNAPSAYALAARAALLAGDRAAAASDLQALEATGMHGPIIEARRTSIRAGLAALDGRTAESVALYREAIRRFRDAGVPLDEAFTEIEMATFLDPAIPEVAAAVEAGREILSRLGARPFLERLEAAAGRGSPARRERAAPARVLGESGAVADPRDRSSA